MSGKVAMFVFNDLTSDARVRRQAGCLAAAGYQVRVYGFPSQATSPYEQIRGPAGSYEVYRLDQRGRLDRAWDRLRPRRPQKVQNHEAPTLHWPNPRAPVRPCPPPPPRELAQSSSDQRRNHRRYILRINHIWASHASAWKPDFCQAHDLDTLWAAQLTALRLGVPLIYDSHEIWSEQHFLTDWEEVTWWDQWEARLSSHVDGWLTVNQSLAEQLQARYGAPVVALHNCPYLQPLKDSGSLKGDFEGRPVALFSGGFQASRGLEQMLAAALLQKEVAIVLQGFGHLEESLKRLAKEHRSPVRFLPRVPPEQVTAVCAGADIGVMPVLPDCLNSYYCTPNKVFDYMMAGLALVAADIPEMSRIVKNCGNGLLYDAFSPQDLAASLQQLVSPEVRGAMAQASRHWAERHFHWEAESQKLLTLYHDLRAQSRAGMLMPKFWVDPQRPMGCEPR